MSAVGTLLQTVASLAPVIRECAGEAERLARLPNAVACAMAEAGLYRLSAPKFVDGQELCPRDQIAVIEAVSRLDGATGWNLMIGMELMSLLGAVLPESQAREIFADRGLIVCGALNPMGKALRVPGGYRVSGRWPFISGCHNATLFWGQCIVFEGDAPAKRGGQDEAREALVPMGECQIHSTWNVSGLRGSGSHEVEVHDAFVPDSMMTRARGRPRYNESPLYRLPFFTRVAYNKVGVATGIARGFLDDFIELAATKTPRSARGALRERPNVQIAVADAEVRLRSARAWVLEVLDQMWDAVAAGHEPSARDRALAHLACTNACSAAVSAVSTLHEATGTTANFTASPLERRFRDVHVVRQHVVLSRQWNDEAGRVLLGLPSGGMFF